MQYWRFPVRLKKGRGLKLLLKRVLVHYALFLVCAGALSGCATVVTTVASTAVGATIAAASLTADLVGTVL